MTVLLEHGLVNAGGDPKALGTKNGEPSRVAVRHPRKREPVLTGVALVPLCNTCFLNSGDEDESTRTSPAAITTSWIRERGTRRAKP